MDFFHGKYNGEWKVKVVARVGALIPTFIIIGKTSKLVVQRWKSNKEAKGGMDAEILEESVVIDGSKTGESMKKLEEELQVQRQACKDKEGLLVANRQELDSLRKEMQGCREKEGLLISSRQSC